MWAITATIRVARLNCSGWGTLAMLRVVSVCARACVRACGVWCVCVCGVCVCVQVLCMYIW